jgi:hypothetical protein
VADVGILAKTAAVAEPEEGLTAVSALRRVLDHLEAGQVGGARAAGWTWQEIADLLGVSRQAVHKKYAHRIDGR